MRVKGGYFRLAAGLCLLGMVGLGTVRVEAQPVTVEAMLIHASDRPAPMDHRMERVEYRLRRIFGFEHYRFLGKTSSIVNPPAEIRMNLDHGYSLHVNATSGNGRIRANIRWMRDRETLLSTAVNQRRGVPAILGGPPHEEGTLILVLTFE